MARFGTTGFTVDISTTLPATRDASGFGALSWTSVGNIDNVGSREETNISHPFTPADTGVTAEINTGVDYGSYRVTCYYDTGIAAQATLDSQAKLVGESGWIAARIVHPASADGKTEWMIASVKDVEVSGRGPNEGIFMFNFTLKLVDAPVLSS